IQHLREKFGLGIGPTSLVNESLVPSASVATTEEISNPPPSTASIQVSNTAPLDADLLDEFADVL
ncbi:MAG: hypothetical protein AAF329_27750, partial [Cyanobacteria bacterium P01_A01_bin.17]